MLSKLLSRFHKPILVEVPVARTPLGLAPEIAQAVLSLSSHPGFRYLCDRLELQASYLDAKLRSERHTTLREVDFLQQGAYWCRWLRRQLDDITKTVNRPKQIDPLAEELELFKQLDQQLERVGKPE